MSRRTRFNIGRALLKGKTIQSTRRYARIADNALLQGLPRIDWNERCPVS